jgi:hypothetical protein
VASGLHDSDELEGIILRAADAQGGSLVSIALNATDKKVVIQTEDKVEIDAMGDIDINGANITIQASKELVLKGSKVKIN